MRVRGLKPEWQDSMRHHKESHPMRVRGLKPNKPFHGAGWHIVAPHAGAWIETTRQVPDCRATTSHPMRVRGVNYVNRRRSLEMVDVYNKVNFIMCRSSGTCSDCRLNTL